MPPALSLGSHIMYHIRSEVVQPEEILEQFGFGTQAFDMQVIPPLGEHGLYLCPELGCEACPVGILFCGCHAGFWVLMA